MEQWIYARLFRNAMEIMKRADEEFFSNIDFADISEDDMNDICEELNKTAFAIGKVLRNEKYNKGEW